MDFWRKFPHLIPNWRLITYKKLLYLPRVITRKEVYFLFITSILALASGVALATRLYLKITSPLPDIGGSYTEGLLKEPRTINPIYASSNDTDRDLVQLIFSRLISYTSEGEVLPDLAENYEISPDGKTYILRLRKNVRWHDGKPFSAEDAAFTIKLIQNPLYRSPLRANWQGVEIETLDNYTIKFTLRTPYPPFIENLTLGIIPRHLWENIDPEMAALHELNLKPVGTGPYRFKSMRQSKEGSILRYDLARNSHYYREGPYLKHIRFFIFQSEEELHRAWNKGVIEGFGPVSGAILARALENKDAAVFTLRMPRIFSVFFNESKAGIFKDKKLREALASAVDKKRLVEQAIGWGAITADYPFPFFIPEAREASLIKGFDPERSRQIIEGLKWKDEDGNGIREKKIISKGKSTTTQLHWELVTSDWPELVKAAAILQEMWKAIGAQVTVKTLPFAELESSVIRPRNFEMLLFGQVYGYEPDPFSFWHSSQIRDPGLNVAFYSSREVDRILEETRKIPDAAARRKNYQEISLRILRDQPAIFLYSQLYTYLLPRDIQGVELNKISLPPDRFNEIHKWYRETKRVLK